jgi:hypothetical protein
MIIDGQSVVKMRARSLPPVMLHVAGVIGPAEKPVPFLIITPLVPSDGCKWKQECVWTSINPSFELQNAAVL